MTTTDQTADPLKLARDALQKLACLGNGDKPGNSTGNVIALTALAAIDALPVTKAFPLETVTRLPAERVTELFGRWVAARQQHPAPRGDALSMNEEFLLCLDAFDRQAEPSRSALDVEQLLRECVPGGSVCDPQQIADAIRAYCAALPASVQTVAWHMRVIGCDGSADWLEMGAAHPETPRGVEALPLVYAPASVPSGEPDDLLGEAARAITALLSLIRRNAPELSGKTLGFAEAVAAKIATAPAAPAPAAVPAGMVLVPLRMTQAMRDITDAGEWEWADLLAAANAVTLEEYEAAQAAPAPAPTWAGSESGKLPPLPDTDWLLHMPAAQYEAEWTSSEEGYTADQMRAYALAARTQAPAAPAVAAPEAPKPERTPFTQAQLRRLYDNSPEIGNDVRSRYAFYRVAMLVEAAHGITAPTTQEPQQ